MWARIRLTASLAVLCIFVVLNGCGTDELVFPGMVLPTGTPVPTATPGGCRAQGEACSQSSDCCSNDCGTLDGVNFTCF